MLTINIYHRTSFGVRKWLTGDVDKSTLRVDSSVDKTLSSVVEKCLDLDKNWEILAIIEGREFPLDIYMTSILSDIPSIVKEIHIAPRKKRKTIEASQNAKMRQELEVEFDEDVDSDWDISPVPVPGAEPYCSNIPDSETAGAVPGEEERYVKSLREHNELIEALQ